MQVGKGTLAAGVIEVGQHPAEQERGSVGRRQRTVYAITPEGRDALASWLHEPGAGPLLESEQLLKVFFAESGTTSDTRATLAAARASGWSPTGPSGLPRPPSSGPTSPATRSPTGRSWRRRSGAPRGARPTRPADLRRVSPPPAL